MTAKKDDSRSADALEFLNKRRIRAGMISDGQMPSLTELLTGHDFARGDISYDARLFFKTVVKTREGDNSAAGTVAEEIVDLGYNIAVAARAKAFFTMEGDADSLIRTLIYLSCSVDDSEDRGRLIAHLGHQIRHRKFIASRGDVLHLALVQIGLASGHHKSMREYLSAGRDRVEEIGLGIDIMRSVGVPVFDVANDVDEDFFDVLAAVSEDRAEVGAPPRSAPAVKSVEADKRPGVVVVPDLSVAARGTGSKREITNAWSDIAGKQLPLVLRGDIVAQRNALVERWPHAVEIIDTILGDIAADERIRFRPTILVGESGSGKSALAVALAEAVGLPVDPNSLGGTADSSLMGTSAQWSSARASIPLQFIHRMRVANPCIVWSEIDKTSDSQNGSATSAMLDMLERETARRMRDPALEVPVDLSWVSHLATANSIEGIPKALRDRMRILRMQDPSWKHVGTLVRKIVDEIAVERQLDRRWIGDLDGDEIELIRKNWNGGSIRTLARIVRTIVDGREAAWGRA